MTKSERLEKIVDLLEAAPYGMIARDIYAAIGVQKSTGRNDLKTLLAAKRIFHFGQRDVSHSLRPVAVYATKPKVVEVAEKQPRPRNTVTLPAFGGGLTSWVVPERLAG